MVMTCVAAVLAYVVVVGGLCLALRLADGWIVRFDDALFDALESFLKPIIVAYYKRKPRIVWTWKIILPEKGDKS